MTTSLDIVDVSKVRWFRNGDHPEDRVGRWEVDKAKLAKTRPDLFDNSGGVLTATDLVDLPLYERHEGAVVRYYRLSGDGTRVHEACGYTWHQHGWIDEGLDGQTVCPGDWVITDNAGRHRTSRYLPRPGMTR